MPPKTRFLERHLKDSELLRAALWKYRRWVAVGVVSLAIVDLLEVLPPALLKRSVDVVTEARPLRELRTLALAYMAIAVVQSFGRYGWRMYLIRASMHAGKDLRGRYAGHLFGLSSSFFDRHRVGDLMSLVTSDVEAVRNMIGAGFLILVDALFYFLTVPVAMYLLSPRLTWIALAPLPLVPWIVWRNEREFHDRHERLQACFGELSGMVQESLSGVRVTRAFAKENVQDDRLRRKGEEYGRLYLRLARVQAVFGPTLDFAMSMGLVLLLWVGGRGAVSLGTFIAFQRYIQKMVWPMAALGMSIGYYQRSVSSSGRLKEIFDERSDVPESPQPALPGGLLQAQLPAGWRTPGGVELRRLSFRFPGRDRPVLTDVSLSIAPGERVAFLGAVGAGKSALLGLLPRLYPVERGQLWIDGVDVNEWPLEELRRQVGYVSQDVFLFSESVWENVAFGMHQWIERRESPGVEEATRLASVHDDVMAMPAEYGTRLGERGVNLSGGQKQRLTIARAIAKQPSILVLDDALSSVDVQTEERILKGLRDRPQRNTEIIAAHRISTIRSADRIVVLEGGRVAQEGTSAELQRQKSGLYWRYLEQQRLKEELESYASRLEPEATS